MLQLYKRNQTEFSWNGEPIRHAYNDHVVRDDTWTLTFRVLLDKNNEYKQIKRGMVVKAWTPDGDQPFRVWDIIKGEDYIEIVALHILYDLDTKLTNPIHVNNGALDSALYQFKAGLPSEMGPFTFSTGITKFRTYNTEDIERENNKYNALSEFMDGAHSIVGTWEAELLINGWDIRLLESVGSRTGALLYEKKNIHEFEDEESNRPLITRIYAESTYTPEREEGASEEPNEVHLSVVVESPLIDEYEQVYEAIYVNNDMETEAELKQWAKRKFTYEKVDLPSRSITLSTNVIDDTEINYGDYVVLKYPRHDVDEEIRCVGYDVSPINQEIYEITLGSNVESVTGAVKGTIQDLTGDQLSNEMIKIAEQVTKVIMSSNGFNRIAFGPEPVPNPIEGDLWYEFQFDTPNQVAMKRWMDGRWVIVIDDFMGERIKEEIKRIYDKELPKLQEEIDVANENIDRALEEAGMARTATEAFDGIASGYAQNAYDSAVEQAGSLAGTTKTESIIEAGNLANTARVQAIEQAQMLISENNLNVITPEIQNTITSEFEEYETGVASRFIAIQTNPSENIQGWTNLIETAEFQSGLEGLEASFTRLLAGKADSGELNNYVKTADYNLDLEGISGRLTEVESTIIEGVDLTDYVKTADYNADISGLRTKLTESLNSKADSTELSGYVKTAIYDAGINGLSASLSEIRTNPSSNIEGWDDLVTTSQIPTDYVKTADYASDIDGIRNNVTSIMGDEYKSTQTQLTVDAINQIISTGSNGHITNLNALTNTVDSMEQIIGTTNAEFENNVSRILQTSDLIQSTVESSINAELETEYKTVVSYVPYDDLSDKYNLRVRTGTNDFIFLLSKKLESGKVYRFTIDYTTYNGAKNATTTLDYGGNTTNTILYATQTQAVYFLFVPANAPILPFIFSIKFSNALSDSALGWGIITGAKVDVSETTQVPINGTNTGAIRTEINQLYNMINMQVLGVEGALSRLSIGEQGLTLQSQLIHLSGKSIIDDAVIKSAMIESMTADKLTAGEINAAQIRVINLDARSIAGYEATFIQAMFNGLHSRVRINGAGMDVLTNDGTVSSHFDENGIEIFKDGVLVGEFESRNSSTTTGAFANKKSISMTPERSAYASISYFKLGQSNSTRVISVNGNNGDIYVNPLSIIRVDEDERYGIRLTSGTIGGVPGVRLYNHDDTGGLQITPGNVYWRTMDGTWANLNDAAAGAYMP